MKKNYILPLLVVLVLASGIFLSFKPAAQEQAEGAKYEFTSITVLESIVPNGIGRSRIIHALAPRNYKDFTKVMSEEDKTRNKSKRGEIRVKNYEETKLLNFYNMGGIRFQNIAANDAVVNSRVNQFLAEGWEIVAINSGVEGYSGKEDTNGIYLTRFYFKREVQ